MRSLPARQGYRNPPSISTYRHPLRQEPKPHYNPPVKIHYNLSPWNIFLLTVSSSLIIILGLSVGAVLVFYGYYQITGVIVPGVKFGNTSLSGMNLTQASQQIAESWGADKFIQVTNGTQSAIVTPADLGIELDAIRSAEQAFDVGHNASLLAEMAMMFRSYQDGWIVTPVINLDETIARHGLENLKAEISQSPKDASFHPDGESLVSEPSQVGYTIDIEKTLAELQEDPQAILQSGVLQVIPQFIPAQVNDASPFLAEAQRLLDTPRILYAYDPISDEHFQWPIPREDLASWLDVESTDQGLQVSLEKSHVAAFLDSRSGEIDRGRYIDSTRYADLASEKIRQGDQTPIPVSHYPTTYQIQRGDTLLKIGWNLGFPYWMILQANPGIDPDNLIAGTRLSIPSKDELLPLPIVANKRIIINISAQRLSIYQDGALLGKHSISTGIDRSPTQPGVFQVQTHDRNAYASVWDLYMPNFLGIYEAWPGFMNGIHGLPTLSNGQRLWANILGRPASYGCIILDLNTAEWLFNWAENGVVVEIQP
jgi:lipoprotein-anchoring transpeptidase ErfK/SrfK